MEKPRKKECSAHSKYNRQCYECKCQFVRNAAIDAMSTWLEGEVKKIMELTDYPEEPNAKNMNEDLVWDYKERLDKIHVIIARKLTGKV